MATSPTCKPAGESTLGLRRETHRLGMIVRVAGEIDLNSHLDLRSELLDACTAVSPPAQLVVDLTGVEFLSSVGLSELLTAHELASSQRTPMRLVVTQRLVLRPIQVTGLDRKLDIYPSVEEALRAG